MNRQEARALLLDALSRRTRRVVRYNYVVDLQGATLAHRKLFPHLKEWIGGDANETVPPLRSKSHCVGVGSVTAKLGKFALNTFANEHHRQTTVLLSGDPFDDADFAARFSRACLPADVGGELRTGADGRCCLGIELPTLNDTEALCNMYEATRFKF